MEEYIIYCDESDKSGKHFSNFYGGLIINTKHIDEVTERLTDRLTAQNLNNELKWSRVTENYLEKYKQVIDLLFDLIEEGKIKIRIMFTQNIFIPQGLTAEQKDNEYTLLYYQFIKNAFGLKHAPTALNLRIYVDKLPETKDRSERFKDYLRSLEDISGFRNVPVIIKRENVTEIDSKKHILLQQLDIVLGAMQFRLNDKHLEKAEGSTRRGKRTIAKEKLYNHIRKRICEVSGKPHFNVGNSTSTGGNLRNLWEFPYMHWKFVPKNFVKDTSKSKRKQRKSPHSG